MASRGGAMGDPMTLEEMIGFLLDAPLFAGLEPDELARVVRLLQVQRLKPDQWVFREGEAGDAWYVVYEGGVEIVEEGLFGEKTIAELGPRMCFGEVSVLDGSRRSASVRALSDATVFRLPRRPFEELLRAGDLAALKLVHQIARVLAVRQRETTNRLVGALADRGVDATREGMPLTFWPAITE